MKIELQGQRLRVTNYQNKTYVDVSDAFGHRHYSHQIDFYPDFHYCALVKNKLASYCLSLVIFQNKESFDEWKEAEKGNYDIVEILTK